MRTPKQLLLPIFLLTGCATVPPGPRVAVMPAPGISLEQFEFDDRSCRRYAERAVPADANDAAADNVAAGAVVGTVLGAAVGALVGGHHAAATGAGIGLAAGATMGAGNADEVQRDVQHRYDLAYAQCMSTKGHELASERPATRVYRERVYPDATYERTPDTVIIRERVYDEDLPPRRRY